MPSDNLAEIIASVQKLSFDDQEKVIQSITAIRSFKASSDPVVSTSDIDLLLSTITDVLRDMGIEHTTPMILKRASAYRAFKEKAALVEEWLEKQKLSRVEKRAFLDLAIRLLHKNLQGIGIPIGSRMIMLNIDQMPVAVDRAFPGYAAMGILAATVRGTNGKIR